MPCPRLHQVRIETDLELSMLTVNLICRSDGVYWSCTSLEMEVIADCDGADC